MKKALLQNNCNINKDNEFKINKIFKREFRVYE